MPVSVARVGPPHASALTPPRGGGGASALLVGEHGCWGWRRPVPSPVLFPPVESITLPARQHGVFGRVSDMHFGLTTLHDLVGMTVGAKDRNAYDVALLLKKAAAWQVEW